MEIQDLSTVLRADPRFNTRKKWLVLSELIFAPTSEKVHEGFRYFTCSAEELSAVLGNNDFAAMAQLPFALDDDGDPDTSSVRVDLAYTDSGAFAAFQVVEYRDYRPTPLAEPLFIEGDDARALRDTLRQLDQSA